MNGIQIDRLKFKNYRQYGTAEICFKQDENADTHLFAFIAQNGTGKTTILKAITWCLYGKEASGLSSNRSVSKGLPLVNTTTLALADTEEKVPVSVAFRFINDNGDVIEFTRETSFLRHQNGVISQGPTKFIGACTPSDGNNTVTLYDEQADIRVKQYFDPAIYNFYFFDGEKLAGLFETNLKDSIYNIAQVNMLENTIKHTNSRKKDLTKKLGTELPDINEIQNSIDENTTFIRATKNRKGRLEEQITELTDLYDKYDNALRNYKPVQQLQVTRTKLLNEQKEIEAEYTSIKNSQITFIQKYLTLLNMYPRIKKVYDYISSKENTGCLPPTIDRTQIINLLNQQDKNCPLCGMHLDEKAVERLKNLLKQYAISSATSNFLSMMIGPLESAIADVKEYQNRKSQSHDSFRKIDKRKRENEKELALIEKDIMQYGGESGISEINDLNEKYINTRNKLINLKGEVNGYERAIDQAEKEKYDLNQKLLECQKKVIGLENVKKQLRVFSVLSKSFTYVRDAIVNETKVEMQSLTWKAFSSMTWKKNTFGKISIDDKYNVILYDKRNQVMNRDASGAEAMALAYAFTLSVHQVSGKNCPLVIDSPLGRVSDEAREKMAAALLQVAKEKQIIMLFTPDEYSDAVKKLYEKHATVKQLKLSSDESIVEGVKPYGR